MAQISSAAQQMCRHHTTMLAAEVHAVGRGQEKTRSIVISSFSRPIQMNGLCCRFTRGRDIISNTLIK